MSVYFDRAKGRWRWQFETTAGGRRVRLSRLLPGRWSESQARRFDEQETARTYARLAAGADFRAAPIEQAVALPLL